MLHQAAKKIERDTRPTSSSSSHSAIYSPTVAEPFLLTSERDEHRQVAKMERDNAINSQGWPPGYGRRKPEHYDRRTQGSMEDDAFEPDNPPNPASHGGRRFRARHPSDANRSNRSTSKRPQRVMETQRATTGDRVESKVSHFQSFRASPPTVFFHHLATVLCALRPPLARDRPPSLKRQRFKKDPTHGGQALYYTAM